jgi:hypothetical protein
MAAAAKLMPNFLPSQAAAAAQVIFSPFIDGSLKLATGPRLPYSEANLFNQMCQTGALPPPITHSTQSITGTKSPTSQSMANNFKLDSQSTQMSVQNLLMDSSSPSKQMPYKEVPLPADLSLKNRHQSRTRSPLNNINDNNKDSKTGRDNNGSVDTPLNLSKAKSSPVPTSASLVSQPSLITSGINGSSNYMSSSSKSSFNQMPNQSHSSMSPPTSMPPMISSLAHPPPPPPSAFFGNPGMTPGQYFHHAYNALGLGFRPPHMGHDMSSLSSLSHDKAFNPFGPLLLPDMSKMTPTSTVTSATIGANNERQRNESQQSQKDGNTDTIVTCQSNYTLIILFLIKLFLKKNF